MKKFELNPDDYLVERLDDYYKVKKGMDTNVSKEDLHAVGVIKHVGANIEDSLVGKIIYYHKNTANIVNCKGIGSYDLVPSHLKLMIRLDQTKENY